MTVTDVNQKLKLIDIDTLMKPTSVIHVYDSVAHVTYKADVKTLAKAIAKQLVQDGVIPGGDD